MSEGTCAEVLGRPERCPSPVQGSAEARRQGARKHPVIQPVHSFIQLTESFSGLGVQRPTKSTRLLVSELASE